MFRNAKGEYNKLVGIENRKRIIEWIEKNPNSSKADCLRALNISRVTLNKHLDAMEQENFIFDKDTGAVIHKEDRREG